MASFPSHIQQLINELADPRRRDDPDRERMAMCLADEITDWLRAPDRWVPREVLVNALSRLADRVIREPAPGSLESMEWWREAKGLLAGQCPAWFVIADWERMTDEERAKCETWALMAHTRLRDEAEERMGMGVARDDAAPDGFTSAVRATYRLEWLAAELRRAGHVPDGWRLEWVITEERQADAATPLVYGHGHSDADGWFRLLAPMTFERATCSNSECVSHTETFRTYVGRCEQCRTVYATRPTVEGTDDATFRAMSLAAIPRSELRDMVGLPPAGSSGDRMAAHALADLIQVEDQEQRVLLPVRQLNVDASRVRVMVLVDRSMTEDDVAAIRVAVADWLTGDGPLVLGPGVRDVRVYELGGAELWPYVSTEGMVEGEMPTGTVTITLVNAPTDETE